jgi:sulfonate dioxygenase
VTYEIQPPGATILRLYTTPEVGNDTLWSSGYNVYSQLSRPYQIYLESLSAIHTGHNQAASRSAAGVKIPLREPIDTIHPVVRVHPVTGLKAVFVNPGFVTRLVGVPKAESDNTLAFLKDCFAQQTDATTRWRWEAGDVAIWDNRVVNHSATFDAYVSILSVSVSNGAKLINSHPNDTVFESPRTPRSHSQSRHTRRNMANKRKIGSRSDSPSSTLTVQPKTMER